MPDSKHYVNVKVTSKRGSAGRETQLLVDGIDISRMVLRDHFAVHIPSNDFEASYVVIALPVHELDVDLPEALIQAIAVDEATGEVA